MIKAIVVAGAALVAPCLGAQGLTFPAVVTAGSPLSIATSGSGKGTLYLVGPTQALAREVQLGEPALVAAGALYSAGHYVAILTGGASVETAEFDVSPSMQPGSLGFLAKPSRLPVGMHNGISGAIYVFDAYHNLITKPLPGTLALANASGMSQTRSVTTRNGLAWAEMDSSPKEGTARFTAHVGDATSTRIIQQVPGDPCSLSISAHPNGKRLSVETAPVRDCGGNAISDGTIVTFTETYNNTLSTVDVPLKKGIARVDMPANAGARISVASGVVAGNEIRWGGGR